jgi:hypothetical protein
MTKRNGMMKNERVEPRIYQVMLNIQFLAQSSASSLHARSNPPSSNSLLVIPLSNGCQGS